MNPMIKMAAEQVAKMAADAGNTDLLDVLVTELGLDPIRIERHARADLRAHAILDEAMRQGQMSRADWSRRWNVAVAALRVACAPTPTCRLCGHPATGECGASEILPPRHLV